jgi:hypothetical protein
MLRKLQRALFLIVSALILGSLTLADVARESLTRIELVQFETRCGWLSNPTPANIWLNDRDGEWIIGIQGGYQVDQEWPWPEFKKGQWIVTNSGDHGYGCACLQLRVDKQTNRVLEIKSARPRPLAACRKEPVLKKMERTFR